MSSSALQKDNNEDKVVDVCVVGAGMSGLAASQYLAQSNLTFTLLEAKGRIGGRFKAHADRNFVYDEGAHWLHCAERNPLVEMLRPQSPDYIKTPVDTYFATPTRFLDELENKQIWKYYNKVWSQVAKVASERKRDRAISTLAADQRWQPFFNSVFASTVGSLPDEVSIRDLANYVDSEIDFAVESGLGSELTRAFSSIPVQFNHKVIEIERGELVRISTQTGQTISARSCLLTVSPPVMKKIKFSPSLPASHQDALDEIKMGLLETIALEFYDDVFGGRDNVHLFLGTSQSPQLSYLIKPGGRNFAVAYFGGEALRSIAGDRDRLLDTALKQLALLYDFDGKKELWRAAHSNWTQDEDVMGGLSYTPVGHSRARCDLRTSIDGQLFFAGEATSITGAASLHGAYEEGVRAAKEIMDRWM